jgi:sigma-B regulation protein RsbU (phosphoserine phosphatase)
LTLVAEAARLAAVVRYDILDTPPDGAFDRIAALAARLLNAPIATVTIVDTDRIWFKATHGLKGVTQIGREPGLCASAIQQDGPYLISDAGTDPRSSGNSLVRGEMGIRFYAAAPITTSDGFRLGTVNVLGTEPRELGGAELATLTDLASIVMDELELRLSALLTLRKERELREQAEHDRATLGNFASTLQKTLLPPALPDIPGVELACHYYAASAREVGGDFYDVFSLGDDRWAFFLGDVEGHGAEAATVTSLTRYTLRAAALHNADPAAGLAELNTALLIDPHARRFCTVLFGIASRHPSGGFTLTIASGGHPPALLLGPAEGDDAAPLAVEEVSVAGGMLAGAFPDAVFLSRRVHLREGQTLLLYTDGLTEARAGGEMFGENRLADFLRSRIDPHAATVITELSKLISEFNPPPRDDVALLAMTARRS